MRQTLANYRIDDYQGISIECWSVGDLVGLRTLLEKEGCPRSENLFTDEYKAVELDEVQRRISQKRHSSKLSSMDMLLHVNRNKLLLGDAKFRLTKLQNLDRNEISKKWQDSKAIVSSDYSFVPQIYILLRKELTRPAKLSLLKRMVSQNPNWRLVDAEQFWGLFEQGIKGTSSLAR